MGKYSRWFVALVLAIAGFSANAHAGTCQAYGENALGDLLKNISQCEVTNTPGHFYIELTNNSYIAKALVIPENTTVKGNLSSDPGKPVTLESNFNPDDSTYKPCFGLFQACGKVSAPDCLITLGKGASIQNVNLTKVFAKKAICADSDSLISNVVIDGLSMDLSTADKTAFKAVSLGGSYNIIKGVSFTGSMAFENYVFVGANTTGNVINPPEAPAAKPVDPNPPDPTQPAKNDTGGSQKQDSGTSSDPNKASPDPAIAKPSDSIQVKTLGPLQPIVATGPQWNCSLTSAASSVAPVLLFLGVLTFAGLIAYRTIPQKARIRNKHEDEFND